MTLEKPRAATADGSACPEAELLAEYADRVLSEQERTAVEEHLAGCAACRSAVMEAVRFRDHDRTESIDRGEARDSNVIPIRRRWIAAVAATIAAAAAIVLVVRLIRSGSDAGPGSPEAAQLMAALSSEATRPLQGRLTGGYAYAPPPSITRGESTTTAIAPAIRIAAAAIESKQAGRNTPDDKAVLGAAYLVAGDLDRGIAALEDAVAHAPERAAFLSDLSAGYLARGQRNGRSEDLRLAIETADRALRADPNLLEARFNRAVALAALPQPDQSGFDDYLRHDTTGPWADEARARLRQR